MGWIVSLAMPGAGLTLLTRVSATLKTVTLTDIDRMYEGHETFRLK